jgi:hypothetical protein
MEHTEFTLIQVNKNDPATWGRHQIANQITEASLSIIESATIVARHRITTPVLENPDQTHTVLWPELREKAEYFLSIDASVKQNPNKCPDFLIIEYFRRLGITKTKEYVSFTSDKDLSEIKNALTEIGNETLVWLLYLNTYPKIPEFDSFPKNSERWILSKVKREKIAGSTQKGFNIAPHHVHLYLPKLRNSKFIHEDPLRTSFPIGRWIKVPSKKLHLFYDFIPASKDQFRFKHPPKKNGCLS